MNPFSRFVAALVIGVGLAAPAAEIGYIEDFALAKDREEALKLLIPGSEEYYYYHCLHYQNVEQFDRVEELLKPWIKRYNYTPRVREIQNRQALLTYERNPQESLEFIRRQLGIQFNHQRQLGNKPNLPTALNQEIISRQRLQQRALANHKNTNGFEDAALEWLIATDLDPDRRRHLLQRLSRPDLPGLSELVVADLKHRNSKPFGSMTIHRNLLLRQLDDCLRLKPDLRNQVNFVNTYLSKLQPNHDVDWRNDPAVKAAYLDRLWRFVSRLAPVHNSLKAHVLYHRLLLDRSQGLYDQERFMAYLALPRRVSYIEPALMRRQDSVRYPADLNADFSGVTMLPAVHNDEPLVRSFLHHFFLDEATTKPYEPFILDTYLRHNFAETKIVNGLGEEEQWISWLPPEQFQALKDRIDLDFAHDRPLEFGVEEPVSVELAVKNVKQLIVKVFEINTRNYYREHGREVNTNISLDGLVPNDKQEFEYDAPPLRRVTRRFDFPALNRPGVYVIDFIGNGMSSRVVVRKGTLRHLVRNSTAGHIFTVLDEDNERVTDATVSLAGHEYQPNDDGEIAVPFSTKPGRQPIVISRGDFSVLDHFQHTAENYHLAAGIYVDRESVLRHRKAKVALRPALYLNGTPVSLSVLEDVKLVISSTDRDGVASISEVTDFKLAEDREATHEFQVPDRLSQLSFTLQAKVQNLSLNKKVDLHVAESFQLNQIDTVEKIEDLHFTKIGGAYFIDLLGKTGEPKLDRAVHLSIKHRDFRDPVAVTLKTDGGGRIALGKLAGVASITATGPEQTSHTWPLLKDQFRYRQALHGVAGEALELPYLGSADEATRAELSLLEVRGRQYTSDRFAALSVEDGTLRIDGLPRGDYELLLKSTGHRIRIRMTAGQRREGYVLAENRHLEVRGEKPLQVASITPGEDSVRIRLRNASSFARVHVFATRYQPAFSVFEKLGAIVDAEPYTRIPAKTPSLYISGRNIGDEHRYILDRQYASKYPGLMIERPSLLLNPFPLRSTSTGQKQAAKGEEFAESAEPAAGQASRAAAAQQQAAKLGGFTNLDFLGEQSTVLLNLTPDDNGVIDVPRELLQSKQQLHVVAIDPVSTTYRFLSLPEGDTSFLDLRLANGLDPEGHFTQQKQVSVVNAGETLVLPDISTSKFEAYDSLTRLYGLYVTLSRDPKLVEFAFILRWPTLEAAEKRELYSKYACHELNFFIHEKDPEFFEAVVLPYLANKKDQTFMDRWLLGRDLETYLQPWSYAQLNTVERVLLSRRIPADRPHAIRDISHRFDLLPPDVSRYAFLFDSAVAGKALETDGRFVDTEWESSSVRRLSQRDVFGWSDQGRGRSSDKFAAELEAAPAPPSADGAPAAKPVRRALDRLQSLNARSERAREFGAAGDMAGRMAEYEEAFRKQKGKQPGFYDTDQLLREKTRQLYTKLDKTQEWVENNYYRLPLEQQHAGLVGVNAFWRDYARHNDDEPFYSAKFAEASGNFTEMMLALAVIDLPFEAGEHETELAETKLTVKAASPLIAFHEEIREADAPAGDTPILVSQNFFQHNDRYRHVNNQRLDKFVTDEFLVHTVYGCQVVVTNPTSTPRKLDVLVQIPLGAIPVLNGKRTRSVHVDLKPYHTQTIEYHFYFPAAGDFPHYPVHVSSEEQLVAHADAVELHVVEEPSEIDRTSWQFVSQNGSEDDVLSYLRDNNLHRTNLELIAFRMQDADFFRQVTDLLAEHHVYNHTLWSYAIRHDVAPAVCEYLQHSNSFVQMCGAAIDSPLLTINPVVRKTYQHMDYRPLVNARVHQLGRHREILNDRFHQQYHRLLTILGYRRQLSNDELMALTYYMLLQDRIDEAIGFFERVDVDDLETRMQYDYFATYLNLYREEVDAAMTIVARYQEHPVDHWRNAFTLVSKQLDEIQGAGHEVIDPEDRQQKQTQLAASESSFEMKVEAKRVDVNYQNVDSILVNYYLMDLELLFSRNPFVQTYSSQFSSIRPNLTDTFKVDKGQSRYSFPLPDELHNKNVLVEVVAAGQTKSQAYYSNSLNLQITGNYGQMRVVTANPGKPLPRVYVKVYARMQDGSVRFYKDGYTDLRGRFDYASLNTNELDHVAKFSLLILSDQHGAVVREVEPPKR